MEMSLGATAAVICGLIAGPVICVAMILTHGEHKKSPAPNLYDCIAVLAMFVGSFTLVGGVLSVAETGVFNPMELLLITWGITLVGFSGRFFDKSEQFNNNLSVDTVPQI